MTEPEISRREIEVKKLHNDINESCKICKVNKKHLLRFDMILANNNCALSTRATYLRMAKILAEHFSDKPLDEASTEDIDEYISLINEKKPALATFNLNKIAIRQLYKCLFSKPDGGNHVSIRNVKVSKKGNSDSNNLKKEDLLTVEEINRMVRIADCPRDKALISILYEGALRSDEIRSIKIGGVALRDKEASVTISRSKTRIRSVLIILGFPELKEHLKYHPRNDDPEAPLFMSNQGKELGEKTVRHLLNKTAKKAGIDKPIWVHLFRHSRLSWLFSHGMNEVEMNMFAGWSKNSNMIHTYVHLGSSDVDDRQRSLSGIAVKKRELPTNDEVMKKSEECPLCGYNNPLGFSICDKCNSPLNTEKIIKIIKDRQELDTLLVRMKELEPIIKKFMDNRGAINHIIDQ